MKHILEIKPAIPVTVRNGIETLLKVMGYTIRGGGTDADKSACNIYFSKGVAETKDSNKKPSSRTVFRHP